MEVTVRVEWDMGHRLPNHGGQCRNLHGHRYVAEVSARGEPLVDEGDSAEGMVVDFGALRGLIRSQVEKLDHKFLLCDRDDYVQVMRGMPGVVVVPFVPTAENIAYSLLHALALAPDVYVSRVRLYETPTSYAEATR